MMEDTSLPQETRAKFAEGVAKGSSYLKSTSHMDKVRLVRLASDAAKKGLVNLEGNSFVRDALALAETEGEIFQAALDVFLLAKSANKTASENSLESYLSDPRVSGASLDKLFGIYVVRFAVSAPSLDRIAKARNVAGGGPALLLDGYVRKEKDPWLKVLRIGNALQPGRAVVRPRPADKFQEDGEDDALLSAILKEIRDLGPSLPAPRKEYVPIHGLTSYVVRPTVSENMQKDLVETFKSVPVSLTFVRWTLFRSIAAIADKQAVTFLIKNTPEIIKELEAIGDKETVPRDTIVSQKLQELTGVPLQGDWIAGVQEWWERNRRLLRNQIPP
jgi:hypothetical protein